MNNNNTASILFNANDENLLNVRQALKNTLIEKDNRNMVFTMLQRNSSCKVNITTGSRKICAKTLTDLR
jgi:hypothetical protein